MKKLTKLFFAILILCVCGCVFTTSVGAAAPIPVRSQRNPAPLENATVVVSTFSRLSSVARDVGAVDFVELHNRSDVAQSVDDWRLDIVLSCGVEKVLTERTVAHLGGWILPGGHVAVGYSGALDGADINYSFDVAEPGCDLTAIELYDASSNLQNSVHNTSGAPIDPPSGKWATRKSGDDGLQVDFADSFKSITPLGEVYGGDVYWLPEAPAIRVAEIYPAAKDCSPVEDNVLCSDYVKLYNPSDTAVDLGVYRLRTDSGGNKSSSGNTFSLAGRIVEPRSYILVAARDDGQPVSLTNTGGYVWVEDAEGIDVYRETMVSYPDASSVTKKGWAWVLGDDGATWQWTMTPSPSGSNAITLPGQGEVSSTSTVAGECPAGKYRNPETNRCRTVEEAVNELAACDEDEYRNPATNRCKKLASTAVALAVCDEGYERNPQTNRCRKIAGVSTESSLKPCDPGYERNPTTNRCRKIATASAASSVTATPGSAVPAGAAVIGGVAAVGAAGYGLYEWRHPIGRLARRWLPFVGK